MREAEALKKLRSLSDTRAIEGMARYGINPDRALGISIPKLRQLAKEIGLDHSLAGTLWETEIHEARILAGMIDDPELVDENQLEGWVRDFNSWDLCDQSIINLFEKTEFAWQKAEEWSQAGPEFVKRAGFVLMARLAVSDKSAHDRRFIRFFAHIARGADDPRNFVRKAVNWALRQIGKRNLRLNRQAIEAAEKLIVREGAAPRWVASNALRELKSEAVQQRLRARLSRKEGF